VNARLGWAPRIALLLWLVSALLIDPVQAQSDVDLERDVLPAVVQIAVRVVETEGNRTEEQLVPRGSGTVITPHGLILTSAHVLDVSDLIASAEARQAAYHQQGLDRTVRVIENRYVLLFSERDEPPRPRFTAQVVAQEQVNSQLDLAVLTITGGSRGQPVDPDVLDLPFLALGDSDRVRFQHRIFVVGYPGLVSTAIVDDGTVNGFESESGVEGRAWILTDATVSGGSSGGAAIDAAGHLIGVITLATELDCRRDDTNGDGVVDESDVGCVPVGSALARLRPINLALPLLTAAGLTSTPVEPTATPPPSTPPPPTVTPVPTATRGSAMAGGDAAQTGVQPGPGPEGDPRRKWRFSLEAGGSRSPAVVDGIVYVGSGTFSESTRKGFLYAIDADAGVEIWRFDLAGAAASSPTVAAGIVYIGDVHATLYAVDATTGEERWRFTAPEFTGVGIKMSGVSVATVSGGAVYVIDQSATLYALDALTGEERWRAPRIRTPPAVSGDIVYVGSLDQNILALDAATGSEIWRSANGGPDTYPSPVVYRGYVFGCTSFGSLYALERRTGRELWSFPKGKGVCSMAVSNDTVYIGSGDGVVYAIDTLTRDEIWRFQAADELWAPLVVADSVVYIGGVDGSLYAIDGSSGEEAWRFDLGATVYSSPAVIDGVVYVTSQDGYLHAISGSD
jgi:outer membrane protein assembly factor BamB